MGSFPVHHSVLTCMLSLAIFTLSYANVVKFVDTSVSAGLIRTMGKRRKYGGASIADLDFDGNLDLLFMHHDNQFAELYWGRGNGTFVKSSWRFWTDTHALTPIRLDPESKRMHFMMNQGGAFGQMPNPQLLWRVNADRSITEVSRPAGIYQPIYGQGRGRSTIFLNLQDPDKTDHPYLDALLLNATPMKKAKGDGVYTWGYEGVSGTEFKPRSITGPFLKKGEEYGMVTDVDGNGRMELVTWYGVRMFAVRTHAFQLDEITDQVFPKINYLGTVGMCEIDFNRDSLMDLYVVRTNTGVLSWARQSDNQDRLLINVGGKYVNMEASTGVPKFQQSRGCTVGDFDNDGYEDIVLTRYNRNEPDLLLRNLNGKRFEVMNAGFNRDPSVAGDHATAADLDNDGKLDIVLSEGCWIHKDLGGFYRIMMNKSPFLGNYLLVRVLSSPEKKSTSMYAVARASLGKGKIKLMRRVGSPGTVVSNSYIETVHFGLGGYTVLDWITITWTDGSKLSRYNVPANTRLTLGYEPEKDG